MKNNISIFIADDHAIVRDGLKMVINAAPKMEVIGEAENGIEAAKLILKLKPDITLMDIGMPNMNGLEVTRSVIKQEPNLKIIILSMYSDDEYVLDAIQSGVSGYLVKQSAADTLIQAIQSVVDGNPYFSPDISGAVLKAARDGLKEGEKPRKTPKEKNELSTRERQILSLISEALTSIDIGEKLYISAKTVDKHRQNIMNKVGKHDLASLIRYAVENGLIIKTI